MHSEACTYMVMDPNTVYFPRHFLTRIGDLFKTLPDSISLYIYIYIYIYSLFLYITYFFLTLPLPFRSVLKDYVSENN